MVFKQRWADAVADQFAKLWSIYLSVGKRHLWNVGLSSQADVVEPCIICRLLYQIKKCLQIVEAPAMPFIAGGNCFGKAVSLSKPEVKRRIFRDKFWTAYSIIHNIWYAWFKERFRRDGRSECLT